jgi:hexosaminidase
LNPPWTTNILGAQVNLWTEFVPGPLNVEYKIFPRICAEAEVTWTSKAQKTNYNDFITRLVTGEQRLAQMGLNYNHETNTLIGTWGPTVSSGTLTYNITPYVTKRGEIDVSFVYSSGSDALNIYSVALLENGTQVDINTFTSFAGTSGGSVYTQTGITVSGLNYGLPYYILHLPVFHPGSTYTIQASVAENGTANNTNGKVFLPNWN